MTDINPNRTRPRRLIGRWQRRGSSGPIFADIRDDRRCHDPTPHRRTARHARQCELCAGGLGWKQAHVEADMDKITPCLWFDGTAEEAAEFYTSLLPDSHIDRVDRAPADNPSTDRGAVLTVEFTLGGRTFVGLNGGPDFRFTEAISLQIDCEDQAEVDRYWEGLIEGGGSPSVCGWLKDRFGLSWQVIPRQLGQMLGSADRAAAERAMNAMLQMTKLDVAELEAAFADRRVAGRA
jgi:predicted 3-demethylubiquinone-9 3-methyltransferase (glyoxalase superfamily)